MEKQEDITLSLRVTVALFGRVLALMLRGERSAAADRGCP